MAHQPACPACHAAVDVVARRYYEPGTNVRHWCGDPWTVDTRECICTRPMDVKSDGSEWHGDAPRDPVACRLVAIGQAVPAAPPPLAPRPPLAPPPPRRPPATGPSHSAPRTHAPLPETPRIVAIG